MSAYTAFFWGDYHRDTMHLTMIEHGAYLLLLSHYYSREEPLPLDSKTLFRICKAGKKSERDAILSILSEFFVQTPDGYRNTRADREIEKRRALAARRSEAGKRSAARRSTSSNVTPFPSSGG